MIIAEKYMRPYTLTDIMRLVEGGNLDVEIPQHGFSEIANLASAFRLMLGHLKLLMNQIVLEQEQKRLYELDALQAQVKESAKLDALLELIDGLREEGRRMLVFSQFTQMLALIARNDGFFKQALDRCKYPERHGAEEVNQAQADALTWLSALNDQLEETGYLFGLNPSLADMALRPFVRQYARIDEAQWHEQPWPHLQDWLQRWIDSALFAEVMETYPGWTPGTTGPTFVSESVESD